MELIYHYTSEEHLKSILETGELIVSNWEKINKVKPPALWLSLNPIWENTATKIVNNYGQIKKMTKQEQFESIGLVRFVIHFDKTKLCSWKKYKHVSNTSQNVYEQMEKVGIEQGAIPSEWFASFKNIPLKDCISCQKWNGENWQTIIDFQQA